MAEPPPIPEQPLPEWQTWSLITYPDGSQAYTIVPAPLTYYGPSIPLGTDGVWTYGGLSSPAETPTPTDVTPPPEEPTIPPGTPGPTPGPTTVLVTISPEPTTVTVTETVTTTVYITSLPGSTPTASSSPLSSPLLPTSTSAPPPPPSSPSTTPTESLSSTLGPPSATGVIPVTSSSPSSSSIPSSSLSISPPFSSSSSPFPPTLSPFSSSPLPSSPSSGSSPSSPLSSSSLSSSSSPPTVSNSSSNSIPLQPSSSSSSATTTSGDSPIPGSVLPSVTGTSRTYLGLAPGAFLGVILSIVFALLLLLCFLLCWLRQRRKQKRREVNALPTPPVEYTSRLLAGDRDPTREDLSTYPYGDHQREYRRSQIAMMRARGELDDEWDDRLHSPSIRSASIRLPEDDVGTAYSIRERAFAAAGVSLPYAYNRVPREMPSIGTGMQSIAESSNVATITPGTHGGMAVVGGAADTATNPSPSPRKDTQSTQATNDSSAIHMYAAGGRSRMDSAEDENFFYNQTAEGEGASPVASSMDFHNLHRNGSLGAAAAVGGAVAAGAYARRKNAGSRNGSNGSGSDELRALPPLPAHTRNLEEVPRSAMAYPESPVSDTRENLTLIPDRNESQSGIATFNDVSSPRHSQSANESSHNRPPLQPPIFQRVLNKVMGRSNEPSFAIIPPTPAQPQPPSDAQPSIQDPYSRDRAHARISSRDFDFGGGLLFPRPPVHTEYSSASTAKDDMRRWGGVLPSRWSVGTGRQSGDTGSARNIPSSSSVAERSSQNEGRQPQMKQTEGGPVRLIGAPIIPNQDLIPQMRERTPASVPTAGTSAPFLGFGLRPPPPSAFPPERRTSGFSSGTGTGRSSIYYDARSNFSTPMQTVNSGRDNAGTPIARYDSPPPQPVASLRSMTSAQSFQSGTTAPLLPPGLFMTAPDHPHDDTEDALDEPPPMPARDVRQARSLNTIHSVGTAETYDTANPPHGIGAAFLEDEHARFPPPGLDLAPRTIRSIPSDIAPSEAAEGDLSSRNAGSIGRSSSIWPREQSRIPERDVLEEEPPMAATQWRVLTSFPQSVGGSVRTGDSSSRQMGEQSQWRLTLGQPVVVLNPQDEENSRNSHFGSVIAPHHDVASQAGSGGSQNSRGSSNRTNVSHSRDIHSLRASEIGDNGGSNNSKDSDQSRGSRRFVSEHGQFNYPSGTVGDAMLSPFGTQHSRWGEGAGGTGATGHSATRSTGGGILSPSSQGPSPWQAENRMGSQQPASGQVRFSMPTTTSALPSTTPGIRLVGSREPDGEQQRQQEEGLFSAPTSPSQDWLSQSVPRDVSAADGRRTSHTPSFVYRESPLHAYSPLREEASPRPSHEHTTSSSIGHELYGGPGTSTSHSHSHTHGTHAAETTMGTMTEATTLDDHDILIPEVPLSDMEEILRRTGGGGGGGGIMIGGGGGGEPKIVDEEEASRKLRDERTSPRETSPWVGSPRWL
ncbi:hypothetical protein FRC14_000627 [Serendipita sp. 396]|nr:hypothetical protein FRC14_000627 [Serendipita sp. 396]